MIDVTFPLLFVTLRAAGVVTFVKVSHGLLASGIRRLLEEIFTSLPIQKEFPVVIINCFQGFEKNGRRRIFLNMNTTSDIQYFNTPDGIYVAYSVDGKFMNDLNGRLIGQMHDGHLYNLEGKQLGNVNADVIVDLSGNVIYTID